MRLRKEMIERISGRIIGRLEKRELIELLDTPAGRLQARLASVIEEDMMVEDRLNEEVKEILRDHQDEMDQDNIDYSRLFTMIKTKLARERNLVL
ncbi:MAG: DUF507 family protein [bacterium]|nr:DUF507 family protein [bacterium]